LHSSPNRMIKSRRKIREGHVSRIGKKTNTYRDLIGNPERKRQLGRFRRRC
jgi:hypothetical protein